MANRPLAKFFFGFLVSLVISSNAYAVDLKHNPAIAAYLNQLANEYKLNKTQLEEWFTQAEFEPLVIQKMERPYEAKPWYQYEPLFVTNERIKNGLKFWKHNALSLQQAEKIYGVPPSIIVAIIGVESKYAHHMGNFNVFNTLLTLGFKYPKRENFFRKELTQFILLCKEQKWDPFSIKGSYAGAIGMAQFMPSSYRAYAVDFNQQGGRDLIHSNADAIGSIANYLKAHGWQPNTPVVISASANEAIFNKINDPSRKPSLTLKLFEQHGVIFNTPLNLETPAKLYEFESNKDSKVYWLGLNNFYVITRYNTDPKYALVVNILADKLRQARGNQVM